MPDEMTFAERVHRELRDVRWAEPAELRVRARRRGRRTGAATALAVLAVSVVVVVTLRPAEDAPRQSAAGVPVSVFAEVPKDVLLDPAELPVSSDVRLGEAGLGAAVRVDILLDACATSKGLPRVETVSRYSRSQTLLQSTAITGNSGQYPVLSQDVYRLSSAAAAGRFFDDLDRKIAACAQWRTEERRLVRMGVTAQAEVVRHWRPVVRDFAGDQAVLLRQATVQPSALTTGEPVGTAPAAETTVVVRVGDLVTVMRPDGELGSVSPGPERKAALARQEEELVSLSRKAAQRMCPAANPSC
ncbi:hypothetical protein GA0070616_3519 [Micromonospora nigra]|uniref:Uncharacterized protein n=1 Tax=Micromonospora nigra TaxID=145857 RepID=A0A1C6SDZ0_9ACTN|nr:hypothetical protein [Micromonospora nigra]SCL27539.1 hypothetical protein GA0070616_3519 [Micromonospora nigra]